MNSSDDVLLVCSGGGHLRQLASFAERMGIRPERQVWVTFRNGLSESVLAGRRVHYIPFAAPRDLRNVIRAIGVARRILKNGTFAAAVSTGSSPAVAFLPLASLRGIPCHYIESAARADGPSVTGRIVARIPTIRTYSQYPAWADERWHYLGSVFDAFEAGEFSAKGNPRRAVVSVGTQEGYPFPRLFEKLVPMLQGFDEVLYQTGDADVSHLGIEGVVTIPQSELVEAIRHSDVFISHAGVGAALTALSLGRHPILVPRSAEHGEHIDDHQLQIARELERRQLATLRFVDDLDPQDLVDASRRTARTIEPPPISLDLQNGRR